MIAATLYDISAWQKGQSTAPHPSLPLPVTREFYNQKKIVWLQALMVPTSSNCTNIQNLHLQYLGTKDIGKRWISAFIRKLWDMAWDVWKHQNHTLYSTDGPMKVEILIFIEK